MVEEFVCAKEFKIQVFARKRDNLQPRGMRQREKLHLLYTVYVHRFSRVQLLVPTGMEYKRKSTVFGPNRDGV